MSKKRLALFVFNEPGSLRISPALAKEIGFNESIFFLQIEYLIGVSNTEEKDGRLWTYQSLQHLKDTFFPWWSTATISRIAKSLENKNLIHIGNYNKIGYDRTQWYALNEEGIRKLKSIILDDAILQNEKSKRAKRKMDTDKMKNGSLQNETPIPETPTKTPTEKVTPRGDPTPQQVMVGELARVTGFDAKMHGGRLGRSASKLVKAGYLPELVEINYSPGGWWYMNDWRGQKGEMPTPEQIVETIGRITHTPAVHGQNGHTPQNARKIILPDGQIVDA